MLKTVAKSAAQFSEAQEKVKKNNQVRLPSLPQRWEVLSRDKYYRLLFSDPTNSDKKEAEEESESLRNRPKKLRYDAEEQDKKRQREKEEKLEHIDEEVDCKEACSNTPDADDEATCSDEKNIGRQTKDCALCMETKQITNCFKSRSMPRK